MARKQNIVVYNIILIVTFFHCANGNKCDKFFNVKNIYDNYNVTKTIIDNNKILYITKCNALGNTLTNANQLEVVTIHCALKEIPLGILNGIDNLKSLSLNGNEIRQIPQRLFPKNNLIQNLNIAQNILTNPRPNSLANLGNLKVLDMSHNAINNIANQLFEDTVNLEILDLSHNVISGMISGALDDVPKMKILDLSNNEMDYLDLDVFDAMITLVFLSLKNNLIPQFHKRYFERVTQLEVLHIGGNPISNLPAGVFDGLTNLKDLDISSLHLETVPVNILTNNQQLICLDVSGNRITTIGTVPLYQLKQMRFLNLSRNQIDQFSFSPEMQPEYGNLNLIVLDMSYNNISTISGSFNGPSTLREIYLRNNKIQKINQAFILGQRDLETLDLRMNKLVHIERNVLDNNFHNLRRFEIVGNPFECKCFNDLLVLFSERNIHYSKDAYFNGKHPHCVAMQSNNECKFTDEELNKYYDIYTNEKSTVFN